MANYHVNSTGLNPAATPTAPYDTWEKAAANLPVVDGLMAAGDICYVHPSHNEIQVGSINFASGTISDPCMIICGTPNTSLAPSSVGITALQTTAIFTTTTSVQTLNGYVYVYGLVLKMTGSATAGQLTIGSAGATVMTFEECELHNANTATTTLAVGSSTVASDSLIVFNTVRIKVGNTGSTLRFNNRVILNNASYISGTSSPSGAGLFSIGVTGFNVGRVAINGLDCTNLGTAFNLFTDIDKGAIQGRVRNVKLPTGWAGAVNATPGIGNTFEMLNYTIGTGDTNKKFWFTDKFGDAKKETTIVKTGGASDDATAYSIALASSASCAYPSSVYRSPPIRKRAVAGAATTLGISFAYNGATAMTNKDAWIEVEYLGTSGFALGTVYSSCPSFITSAGTYSGSGETWTGFTNGVTAGPNDSGNTTWRAAKFQFSGVTFAEDGDVIVTICMAKPSWTIFVNGQIDIGGP